MTPRRFAFAPLRLCAFSFLSAAAVAEPPAGTVDFLRDVRPILSNNCYTCHGPDPEKREAELRLDLKSGAFRESESGGFSIVPGKPEESLLVQRITARKADDRMPPPDTGKRLTPAQVDVLRKWIAQGAEWKTHWAYVRPGRPEVPSSKFQVPSSAGASPIDAFIFARLEKEGLEPNPEAPRETLIRRVSLDLIGLPPTPAEVEAFVKDASPDAYAKLVDRLLASPHYGERWARPWLDAARYADTNGYEKDLIRHQWPWRDWVIRAINADMPFDQFTIEQLAGDLLPNPTRDRLVATGFHRNAMLNDEGGVDVEEFRVAALVDRVDCTATTWLGTTMACAQCHAHKYDPISQQDYYRFFAWFNNTEDSGVKPDPVMPVPSAEQEAEAAARAKAVVDLAAERKAAEARMPEAMARWEETLPGKPLAPVPEEGLVLHYPLDEVAGEQAAEASGRASPAVFKGLGKADWLPGRTGNSLSLDGRGGYFDCGDVANFERTDRFSYGAWVKLDGKDGTFLARMNNAEGHRGFDVIAVGGRIEVHLVHRWPENAIKVSPKEPAPADDWFHLFVTYDGSGKAAGVTVYVNGKPQAVEVVKDALTDTIRDGVPLHIGLRHFGVPLNGKVDDVRVYARTLTPEEIVRLMDAPFQAMLRIPPAKRTASQSLALFGWFRDHHYEEYRKLGEAIEAKKKAQTELEAKVPKMMVLKERAEMRPTHVLKRGSFMSPGDKVEPGVPEAVFPMPPELAKEPLNRLTFAKWLMHPDHPLTARVIVNRYWREFFGRGIVMTVEDFGAQGEPPTHPDLLDWLATEFIRLKWDVKALHRTIVLSAAYRRSSRSTPEQVEKDLYNVWLARGPRFRMESEMLRDLALAASGRLTPAIGGPSVYPPQAPGIWENSFSFYDTKDRWVDATGPDRYRRGLYTFWRRSAPYPTMQTFDVSTRDVCVVKRSRTNTPLQALNVLNDPAFFECAAGLARRVLDEGGAVEEGRIAYAFRLCVARAPTAEEAARIAALLAKTRARYAADAEAAGKLVAKGRIEAGAHDVKELAAWIVVANAILNLDETLTKG